jgi:hypothetical protein
MSNRPKKVRPSDLPSKRVRAPDGTIVTLKVVNSDSPTLGLDLLAAFQSSVNRIRSERRKRERTGQDAA